MKFNLEIYYSMDPGYSPQVFEGITAEQAEAAMGAYWRDITMPDSGVMAYRLVRISG